MKPVAGLLRFVPFALFLAGAAWGFLVFLLLFRAGSPLRFVYEAF